MNAKATVSADGETITIHIPMTFRKRGRRKLVVTPDGADWAPRPRVDNALVKALARAFRWRRMLDEGVCATIEELAQREKVNRGYMSRVLRLTLLAPDVVEAILDGRQPVGMRLEDLLEGFPLEWEREPRSAGTAGGNAVFGNPAAPSAMHSLPPRSPGTFTTNAPSACSFAPPTQRRT